MLCSDVNDCDCSYASASLASGCHAQSDSWNADLDSSKPLVKLTSTTQWYRWLKGKGGYKELQREWTQSHRTLHKLTKAVAAMAPTSTKAFKVCPT